MKRQWLSVFGHPGVGVAQTRNILWGDDGQIHNNIKIRSEENDCGCGSFATSNGDSHHTQAHRRCWRVPVIKTLVKHFLFFPCTQRTHLLFQLHRAWVPRNRMVHAGPSVPSEWSFGENLKWKYFHYYWSEASVSKHCPVSHCYISSHSIPARHVNTRAF